MSPRAFSVLAPILCCAPALAQDAPVAPAVSAPTGTAPAAPVKEKEDWRDTSGYRFPALTVTIAAAQNMAQAMILRDYCADAKLPAEFVRARLASFSRMTGRAETCRSLLDY
ncbi:MAG: hypothetical protein LBT71_03230 [Azoarcus sp.]|jgi:hypothetical protein|nr:hypothetical protein [Azoarcus sp.]